MKKIVFIAAFVAITCSTFAQKGGPITWGAKIGLNTASMTNMDKVAGTSAKSVAGFYLGVMGQYMLNKQMGLESGLYYSTLGSEVTGPATSIKSNPSYLQLPITFLYKFDMGNGLTLYPDLGLYMGYGIGGSQTTTVAGISGTASCFGTGNTDLKWNSFDCGTTLGVNLEFQKFVFGVNYDFGLTKVNSLVVNNIDNCNRNLRVTIGYFFM